MARIVHNAEVAAIFEKLADLLEIEGANRFRIRAYRKAAQTIANLPREAASMVVEGEDLTELPGIGDDLAGKIAEIVTTGKLSLLEEVSKRVPPGLSDIVALPGVGPKRAKALYETLGVRSIDDLRKKTADEKLGRIPGVGKVTAQKIVKAVRQVDQGTKRYKLSDAEEVARYLVAYLEKLDGIEEVVVAGSYRRRKETVGDLDILVTGSASKSLAVMTAFANFPDVARIIEKGSTRSTIVLNNGMQVDLRYVEPRSFGSALHYFTGSKDHNIGVRSLAVKAGLKLSEYGLFRGDTRIAGKSETEIYKALGLSYIEPELRENGGEIEAAKSGRLPKLIELKDIRGDLHTHTDASDGTISIADMAKAGRVRGYEYLAITDHSKRVSVARGLDEKRLNVQIDEIDRINEETRGIRILKSCEVDILSDGKLDLDDAVLKRLDFAYGAVHYNFALSREKQTERIIRAMDSPHLSILAHPTGRLINRRPPYEVDMERLLTAAAERNCAVEINAHPDRLDLNDIHCRMAKDLGVKIAISTDAHSADGLDMMRFGVDQARRGWLEAGDVINTLPLMALRKRLARA